MAALCAKVVELKIYFVPCIVQYSTESVLWREKGYTGKYSLNPREILRVEPEGFSRGLRLYLPVYPDFSHNTDIPIFLAMDLVQ